MVTLHHVLNLDEDSQPIMSVFVFIVFIHCREK